MTYDDLNVADLREVEPFRIGGVGIGTFFIIGGGIVLIIIGLIGSLMRRPGRLYLCSFLAYGVVILVFSCSRRSSRWKQINEKAPQEVDTFWLVRLCVGSFMALCTIVSLCALFVLDFCQLNHSRELPYDNGFRHNRSNDSGAYLKQVVK